MGEQQEQLIRPEWLHAAKGQCEHGSSSSRRVPKNPVHAWTHFYWPAALAAAVIAFYLPYFEHWSWATTGLLGGAIALLVPEALCFVTGNAQDTLSDWWWATWHITGTQPLSKWTAEHFFSVIIWLWISITVTVHVWTRISWQAGLASAGFLVVWLTVHFAGRWWR